MGGNLYAYCWPNHINISHNHLNNIPCYIQKKQLSNPFSLENGIFYIGYLSFPEFNNLKNYSLKRN